MKTQIKIIFLLLMLSIGALFTPQKTFAQVSVSYQVFYDDLSPYGNWVDIPGYGYVWSPNEATGFVPYATNGYWVYTDEGWTWVSDYPWGWAPFHYGRWYTDETYGPVWIPGYEWGPGWVCWRQSNDYYGWAPMEPGVSYNEAYSNNYYPSHNHWTIMKGEDFGKKDISNYYVNSSNNTMIINNSTVVNNSHYDKAQNTTYNSGPKKADVEKHVGKSINTVAIKESDKPGQNMSNNQLMIYKPTVQKDNPNGKITAPSKVTNYKDMKTLAQKTSETKSIQPNKKQQIQPQNKGLSNKQNPSQQQINSPKKNEGVIQKPQVNPTKKDEGVIQKPQINPYKDDKEVKQQPQVNPTKKEEGVKQQPQVNPTKKQEEVKQPPKVNQSPKENGIKQQENNPQKKEEDGKQLTNPKKDN